MPDTAALVEGDSLRFAVTARDDDSLVVARPSIEWSVSEPPLFSEPPRVEAPNGVLRFLAGRGAPYAFTDPIALVRARSGSAEDSSFVWLQAKVDSVLIPLYATTMSPGATFVVLPVRYPGGILECFPTTHAVALRVVLGTSQPGVAAWSSPGAVNCSTNGWKITALSEGVAELRVDYGGVTRRLELTVRQPALTTMDEVGRCGLTADGEAWCKGQNYFGELGTLTAIFQQPPHTHYQQGTTAFIMVNTSLRFSSLQTLSASTCGTTRDTGRVFCWGRGDLGVLGSTVGKEACADIRSSTDLVPKVPPCTFVPVAVDGELAEQLRFDALQANTGRRCGHVVARGTAGAMVPVDEVWCWGGSYGSPPQPRPGFFQ